MVQTLLYVVIVAVGLRMLGVVATGWLLVAVGTVLGAWQLRRRTLSLKVLFFPLLYLLSAALLLTLKETFWLRFFPLVLSALFFFKFLHAAYFRRPFLGEWMAKVPFVHVTEVKLQAIDRSHGYWSAVTGINLLLQTLALFWPLTLWALYTTAGWYLLFGLALALQILFIRVKYGKTSLD